MPRSFEPSLIEIRLNPFSSTRSSTISEGVFMKDLLEEAEYVLNSNIEIDIKILSQLRIRLSEIESGKSPQHVIVLGEYGQGKSFSLKKIQDDIYKLYNGGIISIPIGVNFDSVNKIEDKLIEDLEHIFLKLDPQLYINKDAISTKYHLYTKPKTFQQSLEAYDKVFKDLNILIYIFIDELDKVVISELSENSIKLFLEKLKLIGDTCSRSISLFIAGTPNCLVKMDSLSVDYSQRFDKIECNFLTLDETLDYIKKKCFVKLKLAKHHPFDIQVKKQIYLISGGNIRNIEVICRELWNYSSRVKKKVDVTNLNTFFFDRLVEPIKSILGPTTSDVLIHFILTLFINNGEKGVRYFQLKHSTKKLNEINNFVLHSDKVKKVGQNFVLDKSVFNSIANKLFN